MSANESTESLVSRIVGKHLGLDFGNARRVLGTWGQADRCVEVRKNQWVLLEIEAKQHHPNTNVLKLWPFLEQERALSVTLVHAFLDSATCRTSTRGKLATWLASRMESQLNRRFSYRPLIVYPATEEVEDLAEKVRRVARSSRYPAARRKATGL